MKTISLIFPGQGAQAVGMGKDLYEKYPEAKHVFDIANEILGFDLKKIVFEGPEDTLKQTQYTQPAIFATSIAAFKALSARFDMSAFQYMFAGHSLGEYSALCSAGAFTLEDGLRLVKSRGEFIQKASELNPGTMAAILGLDASKVQDICKLASSEGVCEAVNFNTTEQIVIAGTKSGVEKAIKLATDAGATKALLLNVSGPFHSSLVTLAADLMRSELTKYNVMTARYPVYTNCDALPTISASDIPAKLVKQINHPVLWDTTIKNMAAAGSELFVEIGPGRVLCGLLRRIDKSKKFTNVEDSASLEKTLAALA